MKKITAKILENSIIGCFVQKGVTKNSGVEKNENTFSFGKGYFHGFGMTGEKFAAKVSQELGDAGFSVSVRDSGNHWAAFNGSADRFSNKNSFFWVVADVTKNA